MNAQEPHFATTSQRADRGARRRRALWSALYVLIAGALFAIAISNAMYEATSPGWLTFHVLLRKSYSVLAFALVGFVYDRALRSWGREVGPLGAALSVGLYSALIELGQRWFAGAHEPFSSQAFDVACGLVGGALGQLVSRMLERRRRR